MILNGPDEWNRIDAHHAIDPHRQTRSTEPYVQRLTSVLDRRLGWHRSRLKLMVLKLMARTVRSHRNANNQPRRMGRADQTAGANRFDVPAHPGVL
jgi:hypothetical protein